jgi:hypothetical protein
MQRGLRGDVVKRQRVLVLEHLAARDLATQDLRENIVRIIG